MSSFRKFSTLLTILSALGLSQAALAGQQAPSQQNDDVVDVASGIRRFFRIFGGSHPNPSPSAAPSSAPEITQLPPTSITVPAPDAPPATAAEPGVNLVGKITSVATAAGETAGSMTITMSVEVTNAGTA